MLLRPCSPHKYSRGSTQMFYKSLFQPTRLEVTKFKHWLAESHIEVSNCFWGISLTTHLSCCCCLVGFRLDIFIPIVHQPHWYSQVWNIRITGFRDTGMSASKHMSALIPSMRPACASCSRLLSAWGRYSTISQRIKFRSAWKHNHLGWMHCAPTLVV